MTATIIKADRRERSRLRAIWKQMRRRCSRADNPGYARYGGRGIKVCSSWQTSFQQFVDDMGPRPAGHVIDRIDNDGDYEPGNCRWASRALSIANRSCSIWVPDGSEKVLLSEYCRRNSLNYRTVIARLNSGVPIERAVNPAPIPSAKKLGKLKVGDRATIRAMVLSGRRQSEVAKAFNVDPSMVSKICRGCPASKAT